MSHELSYDGQDGIFLSGVARAFAILEDLSVVGERSLSDIARKLAVNKNIAFRLLRTLEQLGYIYEYPASHCFRLTYKLSNVVRIQWLSDDVLSQAQPLLRALARDSGELVRLAICSNDRLEWVFAETGSKRLLRIDPAYPGPIIPHVHATSKAWLMTLEPKALDAQLKAMKFDAYTPQTLTSAKALRQFLDISRQQGFALSYDERDLGVAAVAAPVIAGGRQHPSPTCAAVVSISVPSSRVTRDQLAKEFGPMVTRAADRLSTFWPATAPYPAKK
ncbi:MAG: IclR family transcriptional regulator [Hyphomicrobiales bacterium]|nr:IclR family transcriptional regulator [Hyphomicrobiales bacterium]